MERSMKESFLHFVWQQQHFDSKQLSTMDGEAISILKPGQINHHDGPDFLHAKVRIGDTLWSGSVEIHVNGKDWYNHKHHNDLNYKNVVLHVVYNEQFAPTKNSSGYTVPTLSLNSRISPNIIKKYEQLELSTSPIACANHIDDVDEFIVRAWKERLIVERLEEKVSYFENLVAHQNGNWEAAFFEVLTENFGLHANTNAFKTLARSIDYRILLKHSSSLFELEAILFGQAGMLERSFNDDYPNQLKKEYRYLAKKYKLEAIAPSLWRFKQLRPISFPTIRIAQLANLIHHHKHLFSAFQDSRAPENLLRKVAVSDYWNNHYTFDGNVRNAQKRIGQTFSDLVVINAYIPMLFAYGKAHATPDLTIYAVELLTYMKAEVNKKTKLWKVLNIEIADASDSQALIQAFNKYCSPKKCLSCPVGGHILKGNKQGGHEMRILEDVSFIYN